MIEKDNEELELKVEDVQDSDLDSGENDEKTLEIESLKVQLVELQDRLLRALADSENTRRRLEKSVEDAKNYAIISFTKDLICVYDNLARALEHMPENIDLTGIKMIIDNLTEIFQKNGLEQIKPEIGNKFDYNVHQAISQTVNDEVESGTVLSVMQPGYKIKDRLLRPAIVEVSKMA